MYKKKEYDEIFMQMLNNAFKQGLISHSEKFLEYVKNKDDIENFYVLLLSIHSEVLKEVYDSLESVYDSFKVDKAIGSDLDDIGALVNVKRPGKTKGSVILKFTCTAPFKNEKIYPAGLVCSDNEGHVFITDSELRFNEKTNIVTVTAYAEKKGRNGRVSANTVNKIHSTVADVVFLSVTNPEPSYDGREGMRDEEYRDLVKNWLQVHQRGNMYAYKQYFANLDGLNDYRLIPSWDGPGTVKCIVSPFTDDFLEKVYDDLQNNITQASEDIIVASPQLRSVDIDININVSYDQQYISSELDSLQSRIETCILSFFSNKKIGDDFIPFELAVYLKNNINEIKDLNFKSPDSAIIIKDDEIVRLRSNHIEIK